jgi:ribosomal protein S18 acetylase RimI-like enzyme
MTPSELLSIAHRSMALAPNATMRHQPGARHMVRDGVAFTRQDYPGPGFNFAAVLGPSPPLERIVALAERFFDGCPVGYGILVEADAGHPVEAELRAAGWQIAEDEPALVLPYIPEPPPLPAGLEIRRVTEPDDLRAQYEMLAEAFETPKEMMDKIWPPTSLLLDPDIALFAGYYDGKRVCGAMFARMDDIATIHGVATLHAYRRRGFGRALTWAALEEGARRGCASAALRAMGISYEMYQKMGFVPVCKHRTYAAPTSSR